MSIVREYGKDTFLYKTGSGWCGVAIDDFRGNASYLTDVPLDFLYAFKQWIDNKTIPVIFCDEEGSEFRIIVEEFNTYIIHERGTAELKVVDITRKSFVETILKDITEKTVFFLLYTCHFPQIPGRRCIICLTMVSVLSFYLTVPAEKSAL